MIIGLVVTAPAAAIEGVPKNLHGSVLAWLVLSGVCNVGGLLFAYEALRIGKIGLASPIISTEGAVAAIIAVIAGAAGSAGEEAPGHHDLKAALCAGTAALTFGLGLYSTGRVSKEVPLVWAVLPPRVIGVVVVAIPLIVSRRLGLTRRAALLVAG